MIAKSIQGKSEAEIQIALSECISADFIPTLALVFIPVSQDWEAIRQLLNDLKVSIFGATTDTQFTNEGIQENGIVILLLEMHPDYFRILVTDVNSEEATKTGNQIGEFGINNFKNPGFILSAANIELPFEVIIGGIVERAGEDIMLAGGVAGDSQTFSGTVFTNVQHSNKGFIALVLDQNKIELSGIAVSGWKPVGTEKTITKCVGPWIHTIDNTPAMDVLQKYIGEEMYDGSNRDDIVRLNTSYPLQVRREAGSPIMRPTLLLNVKEKSVLCGGTIAHGEQFRFSLPPDFDVIETVVESSNAVKDHEMPEIDALLVFSCVGRLESLGPMINKELEGLADTWGKPMVGFFSMGEFGRAAGGIPEFHGTTCSWVALKEK